MSAEREEAVEGADPEEVTTPVPEVNPHVRRLFVD